MRVVRKWLCWAAMLAVLMSAATALADGLTLAANPHMESHFARFASFEQGADGSWSAYDRQAAQLRRMVSAGDARAYMSGGAALLYPSVRGNAALGLTEVVLNVCLLRSAPLGADSLSVAIGGHTRYDFVAQSVREQVGGYAWERFALPLDGAGLTMLREMGEQGFALSIYGGARAYKTAVAPSDSAAGKAAFERASLAAIAGFMQDYGHLFESYGLWDLNAGLWAEGRAQMAVVSLADEAPGDGLPATDANGQVMIDDRSAVTGLQRLLEENSFYADRVDGRYGANTRSAIREAQQYFGLLPTGQADRALLNRLTGGAAPISHQAGEQGAQAPVAVDGDGRASAAPGAAYRMESVAEIRLDRCWLAQKLLPTKGAKPARSSQGSATPAPRATPTPAPTAAPEGAIAPKNSANYLLVCDGQMVNLSGQRLFLPMAAQAEITLGGQFAYPCDLVCEQDGGTSFGATLLPGEGARLVLYAEIPSALLEEKQYALTLQITSPGGALDLSY